MNITKDIWQTLTPENKTNKVTEALEQIYAIESGRHNISNRREQGRLSKVKKDLELFILDVVGWESNNLLQQKQLARYE